MRTVTKTWVKLTDELLTSIGISRRALYENTSKGVWFDGFVVKKGRNSNRWKYFCMGDWKEWEKMDNYQVAS